MALEKNKSYRIVDKETAIEKVRKCYRMSKENATRRVEQRRSFHFVPGETLISYTLLQNLGKKLRVVDIEKNDYRSMIIVRINGNQYRLYNDKSVERYILPDIPVQFEFGF